MRKAAYASLILLVLWLLSAVLVFAQDAETPTPLPTPTDAATPPALPDAPGQATATLATPPAATARTLTPTPTTGEDAEPTPRPTHTPVPTLLPDERPDAAEPNNRREQARPLPLDAVSGPFTFLPEGDQDWFSVDLGSQTTGLPLDIAVRGTGGLDLVTTIYRADQWTPLALITSPTISTTLPADLTGWLLLKVDNRSPELASGQSYRVEVRRTLPPPTTPLPATMARPTLLPDPLENNWSVATAAPIGVGASYDLNFTCPDPRPQACPGGDHDYLRVTVKAGVRYLITTYDLAPGVDTVLDLYFGSEEVPTASNDDARPQGGLLSTIRWVAPSDGEAVVRVAPRTGGLQPLGFDDAPGSYRLAVALQDTPLAQELETRIAAQTNAPTPAPTAGPIPSAGEGHAPDVPAAGGSASDTLLQPTALPMGEARAGQAVIRVPATALRTAPRADAEVLETLPQEAIVTLLGQVSGAWVKAETTTGVAPGWLYAPDLRRLDATPIPDLAGTATAMPAMSGTSTATTTTDAAVQLVPLDPLPEPTAAAPLPHEAIAVTVQLVAARPHAPAGPGLAPTADGQPAHGLADVRVQLVTAFNDLLTAGVTNAAGSVTLTTDLDAGVALLVRVPAAGLEAVVDRAHPTLTIAIPVADSEGARP